MRTDETSLDASPGYLSMLFKDAQKECTCGEFPDEASLCPSCEAGVVLSEMSVKVSD